jgi:hypothetical protein
MSHLTNLSFQTPTLSSIWVLGTTVWSITKGWDENRPNDVVFFTNNVPLESHRPIRPIMTTIMIMIMMTRRMVVVLGNTVKSPGKRIRGPQPTKRRTVRRQITCDFMHKETDVYELDLPKVFVIDFSLLGKLLVNQCGMRTF